MKKIKKKLGELLLETGMIDDFQLRSALSYQEEWGGRLGSIIIKKGFVSEKDMLSVIENQYGLSAISLEEIGRPPEEVLNLVKVDVAKKFGFFPVRMEAGRNLVAAIADPTDLKTLDDIGFLLGVRVKPVLALESDIARAISLHYEGNVYGQTVQMVRDRAVTVERTAPVNTGKRVEEELIERSPKSGVSDGRKDVSHKAVIEALIDLLVSKGVFTREELIRKIQAKGRF
ncbi:MAG: hypothetical protein M0Z60_04595 [Nitrospiraceae bacterium]|nr:hypothetical protein [Nitrospiraceae bacterium]